MWKIFRRMICQGSEECHTCVFDSETSLRVERARNNETLESGEWFRLGKQCGVRVLYSEFIAAWQNPRERERICEWMWVPITGQTRDNGSGVKRTCGTQKTSGENAGPHQSGPTAKRVINASGYSYFATGLIPMRETVCRRIFVRIKLA